MPIVLTPELMLRAYSNGLFPMAEEAGSTELSWFDPDPRGVLPLADLHVSSTLSRSVRQGLYTIRVDTAFAAVMDRCGPSRPGGERTWLNRQIMDVCTELHRLGFAHSVEAWRDGQLVGGLYGVALGGAFFGESMFSTARDASKVALVHLTARLIAGGFVMHDTQFVTDHLRRLGAVEIARSVYKRHLNEALQIPAVFHVAMDETALVASFL